MGTHAAAFAMAGSAIGGAGPGATAFIGAGSATTAFAAAPAIFAAFGFLGFLTVALGGCKFKLETLRASSAQHPCQGRGIVKNKQKLFIWMYLL
jgi:hypothetical protein